MPEFQRPMKDDKCPQLVNYVVWWQSMFSTS